MAPPLETIDWSGHGGVPLSLPAVFNGVTSCMFVFDTDRDAVSALANALLNPAGGGSVTYVGACYRGFIGFTDVQRAAAADPNSSWQPGRECELWLPLWEQRQDGTQRLVLWAPYIFVDFGAGLIAGREVWGWPKSIATLSIPPLSDPAAFDCATAVSDGPGLKVDYRPLISVRRNGRSNFWRIKKLSATSNWSSIAETVTAALDALGLSPALHSAGLLDPTLPVVNLKQFPDSLDPKDACYQALVNAPCRLTRFRSAGLLDGDFTIAVSTCESHQIVYDVLGTSPNAGATELAVRAALWMTYDFEALAGSVIAP